MIGMTKIKMGKENVEETAGTPDEVGPSFHFPLFITPFAAANQAVKISNFAVILISYVIVKREGFQVLKMKYYAMKRAKNGVSIQ